MTADHLGERLRHYRRASGKTLKQVAAEAGLTASFLSQAERNLTGVSLSSLANIAKSLNIPLNSLFDHPQQSQPDSHVSQRVRYSLGSQQLAYERLSSSFPGNTINAVKMNIPVGYQSELISHEGVEFSFVLSGQIIYSIEGDDYPLSAGDSVHFLASKPHCMRNSGQDPAEVLTMTTMELFDSSLATP